MPEARRSVHMPTQMRVGLQRVPTGSQVLRQERSMVLAVEEAP